MKETLVILREDQIQVQAYMRLMLELTTLNSNSIGSAPAHIHLSKCY